MPWPICAECLCCCTSSHWRLWSSSVSRRGKLPVQPSALGTQNDVRCFTQTNEVVGQLCEAVGDEFSERVTTLHATIDELLRELSKRAAGQSAELATMATGKAEAKTTPTKPAVKPVASKHESEITPATAPPKSAASVPPARETSVAVHRPIPMILKSESYESLPRI